MCKKYLCKLSFFVAFLWVPVAASQQQDVSLTTYVVTKGTPFIKEKGKQVKLNVFLMQLDSCLMQLDLINFFCYKKCIKRLKKKTVALENQKNENSDYRLPDALVSECQALSQLLSSSHLLFSDSFFRRFPNYGSFPFRLTNLVMEAALVYHCPYGESKTLDTRYFFYPLFIIDLITFGNPTAGSFASNPLVELGGLNVKIKIAKWFQNDEHKEEYFDQRIDLRYTESFSLGATLKNLFQIFYVVGLKYGAFIKMNHVQSLCQYVTLPFRSTNYFNKRNFYIAQCLEGLLITQPVLCNSYTKRIRKQRDKIRKIIRPLLVSLIDPHKQKVNDVLGYLSNHLIPPEGIENVIFFEDLYPDTWTEAEKKRLTLPKIIILILKEMIYEKKPSEEERPEEKRVEKTYLEDKAFKEEIFKLPYPDHSYNALIQKEKKAATLIATANAEFYKKIRRMTLKLGIIKVTLMLAWRMFLSPKKAK